MERVGKMWDNLRKGCRTLFHPEGNDGADVLHVQGPQRGHHCVSSEPQGPEKGVQADGWPEAIDPLLSRRDSYSRHTPWGGRKRLSSAQTPSSPEMDRRSGGSRRSRWQRARPGPDAGSLRCRLRNTVVLCLPLPQRHPSSPRPSPKVRLAELTMEECPFRPGSDLARKWHEIKRQQQQQQQQLPSSAPGPAPARPSPEDEEESLRERRRLSIEAGVDAPPHAQIHTVEGLVPVATLYGLGPKLAPGGGEGPGEAESDPEDDATPLCLQARRPRQRHSSGGHAQIDFIHCLVPDLHQIAGLSCYWGPMDRYQAEALLEGKPEGTFLLRDSAQEDYLFSVSFRRYGRSLHARVEQWNHNFSFDAHDPCVFHAPTVTGLLEHYRDPGACMFFEPLLTAPLHRTAPFSLQHLARAAFCRRATYDGIGALPLPPALRHYLQEYHYKQRVRVRPGEWQAPRPK